MQVTLGYVYTDKRHMNKSINNPIIKNCSMIFPFNILEPSVSINYAENLINYNYCAITLNNKTYYYYIMNRTIDKHNLILSLHLDSLNTYKNEILNSKCHIIRSNLGSKYIVDNLAKKLEGNTIRIVNLGTGFTKKVSYVMIKGK